MKLFASLKRSALFALLTCSLTTALAIAPEEIVIDNYVAVPVNDNMNFSADIVLDALKLKSNRQIFITPIVEDGKGNSKVLPAALVNGRAMQIAWERGSVRADNKYENGVEVAVRRKNGKPQTIKYHISVPIQKWMLCPDASVKWMLDTCGCGHYSGSTVKEVEYLSLNPAKEMRASYMVPMVKELPIIIHEGRAKVLYEVNSSKLHAEPYVCKDGQPIDNTLELKIIDDSVSNALKNINMEIAKIKICGYASPDGPYIFNENLSTARSRSLAEYLADRYNLAHENCEYSAVAEDWKGFRKIVEEDTYLKPEQREALLALIDRPAYGPSDYDAKEQELRTNPMFKEFYNNVILPEWFPQLRITKFEIQTRLKPLSDEELAKVIKTDPEKMSLNQMFRVSKLYPEGSKEFNEVMDTMLRYYPDDEAANLNAASAALKSGDIEKAERLLPKAGNSLEAENARGILETWQGDFSKAREYFRQAGALSESSKNLELLGE